MGFHRFSRRDGRPLVAQPGHCFRCGHAPHQLHDPGAGARLRYPGGNGRLGRWRLDGLCGRFRKDPGGGAAVQRSACSFAARRFRTRGLPAFEEGTGGAHRPLECLPGGPSRPVGPHYRRGSEGGLHGPCLPAFLRRLGRGLDRAGGGLFRADNRDAGDGDVSSGGG